MSYNQSGGPSAGGATIVKIPDRKSSKQPALVPTQTQQQLGYNYMNVPVQSQVQSQPQQQPQPPIQQQQQLQYRPQIQNHGYPQMPPQGQGQNQNMYSGAGMQPQQGQTYGYPPQQKQQNYNSYQPQPQLQSNGYAPQQQKQYQNVNMGNTYAAQNQNQYSQQQQMPMPHQNQNNGSMYMNRNIGADGISQQSAPTSRRKVTLKLVILGNSGVGKTSLMHRYHSNKFTGQYKATIGADFLSKQLSIPANPNSPPQQATLTIWDTAGQERFQSLGKAFYRGSDACILVYDVTDRSSFDELGKWKEEFDSCLNGGGGGSGGRGNMMNNRLYNGSPLGRNTGEVKFIVVANKADKDGPGRVVDAQEGKAYATSIGGEFYECSAKTALNVDQAFVAAAKSGLEYNNRKQMTTLMMNGAGHAGMKGYVPPRRTVDLNRGHNSSFDNNDCC